MIKYNFTIEDFIAYRNYVKRNSSAPLLKIFIYIIMAVIFAMINNYPDVLFRGNGGHSLRSILLAIVMSVFFILYDRWSEEKWYPKRVFKKNPGAFGEKEIMLTDDKLILERDNIKSEIPYNKFLGLVDEKYYYFVITSKKSAIVIPKRDITEKTDEDILKSKIQLYRKGTP